MSLRVGNSVCVKWKALIILLQCNVLLEKLWSWHSCRCRVDMYHLPKHLCRLSINPLMATLLPDGSGPNNRTMCPATCRNCSAIAWGADKCLDLNSKFPRSQSDQASMRHTEQVRSTEVWWQILLPRCLAFVVVADPYRCTDLSRP